MTKQTKLGKLRELRRMLEMRSELCNFDTGSGTATTDFIRESTRLWRETWILPVLDQFIADELRKRSRVRNKRR